MRIIKVFLSNMRNISFIFIIIIIIIILIIIIRLVRKQNLWESNILCQVVFELQYQFSRFWNRWYQMQCERSVLLEWSH